MKLIRRPDKQKNQKTRSHAAADVSSTLPSFQNLSYGNAGDKIYEGIDYRIPEPPGHLLNLIKAIISNFWPDKEVMIWLDSIVWPSWEHKDLIRMMLKASDLRIEPQDLYFHYLLFSAAEQESMVSYAYVFSIFRYDFSLTGRDSTIVIEFSHDDYFTVHWNTDRKPDLSFLDGFTSKWEH